MKAIVKSNQTNSGWDSTRNMQNVVGKEITVIYDGDHNRYHWFTDSCHLNRGYYFFHPYEIILQKDYKCV